jgi:hypothetical protein
MDEWELDGMPEWAEQDDYESFLRRLAGELADTFFLSDNDLYPSAGDAYDFGQVEARDWWPLVRQLDDLLEWETVLDLAESASALLAFERLPTELLEAPLDFLEGVLDGNLPLGPSGRKVSGARLLKIAQIVVRLAQELPQTAQAAVRAWADVHRSRMNAFAEEDLDETDLAELLFTRDLPPAVAGFNMVIAMTLMRWPARAEGLPLPSDFLEPDLLVGTLAEWEALPDSPAVTDEGSGHAEALFAQGQLAHALAQMSPVREPGRFSVGNGDMGLAFSRLSRAILWIHHQCRRCPEREAVGCKVASIDGSEQPTPLLDVASEIANEGRIKGCIKM